MKLTRKLLGQCWLPLLLVLMIGCEPQPTTTRQEGAQEATPTDESAGEVREGETEGADVKQEVKKEVAETDSELASDTQEEFLKSARDQLEKLDAAVAELREQSVDLAEDARQQLDKQLAGFDEQRQALTKKMDELESASADAWQGLQQGVHEALSDLRQLIGGEDGAEGVTSEDVRRQVEEAARAVGDLAKQTKDEFLDSVRKHLENVDQSVQALRKQSAELAQGARQRLDEQLADFQQRRDKLMQQLDQVEAAGDDAWQDLQQGVRDAFSDLQRPFEEEGSTPEEGTEGADVTPGADDGAES